MAYTDYSTAEDYIRSLYDTQRTAAQSAYDTSIANLNTQISNANTTYQPQRNQAYVDQLMQQRLYNENMANMGYSAGGVGMSQTLQQRASNNLLTNLAAINQSQQEYINQLESEKLAQNTSLASNLASIGTSEGSALVDVYNTEQSRADQLYAAGIISAAQYEQMTGIAPQKISSGSGVSYTFPTVEEGETYGNVSAAATGKTSGYTGIKDGKYYFRGEQVTKSTYETYVLGKSH